jgi:hypothetical protein
MRRQLPAVGACTVLAAILAFAAAPALAAPPEAPEALVPKPLFRTVGVLRGVLDPARTGGPFEVLSYEFVYRQSATACQGAGEVETTAGFGSGQGKQEVSAEINGLAPRTEYSVCVVVHNEAKTEEAVSPKLTFTTPPKEAHISTFSFGTAGSEPGQFSEPQGVAVNDSTSLTEPAAGDVYVLDEGNDRVERFSSSGEYLGQFNGSGEYEVEGVMERGTAAPTGVFSFSHEPGAEGAVSGVAVDDSTEPLDPSKGDVYVTDTGHHVVDKFSPSGVYLAQLTGACEKDGEALPCSHSRLIPFKALGGVAVDLEGELWVFQPGVAEYHSGVPNPGVIDNYSGAEPNVFEGTREVEAFGYPQLPGFAVGPEDHLYVHVSTNGAVLFYVYPDTGGGSIGSLPGKFSNINDQSSTDVALDLSTGEPDVDAENTVFAYDQLASREEFGSHRLIDVAGLAVNSSQGNALSNGVYVADTGANTVRFFDYGIVPEVTTAPASNTEVTQEAGHATVAATLNGKLAPGGLPITQCEFEYGTSTSYGHRVKCEQTEAEIGTTGETTVTARITGLLPDTTYHFRLLAANKNDEASPAAGREQ